MKKILSLALASAMLLTSACGTPAASQSPEAASPSAGAPATESSQVVTLDIMKNDSRPMNEHTEKIHQWTIDNLQVDMQITQLAENYNQQLALLITSGEMPDVMWLSFDTYLEYAKQGAFMDISDKVSEYPTLMAYMGDSLEDIKVDGAVYGVPSMTSFPTPHVTNIRKDWLDKVGLPVPKTLDEYTAVLRAFTKDDPDGNSKNDTFGFSCYGYSYLSQFFGAFGASSEQDYFLNSDGSITTNVISDGYKEALGYLKGIYAEGLLDPEIFTATYEQAQQKWGRGNMGIWTSGWSGAGNAVARFAFQDLQPTAEVEVIMPPIGPDGKQYSLYAPPFGSVIALSRDLTPEKVDAALRLLDCQSSQEGFYTFMYGVKGSGYETDSNGLITWSYVAEGKDKQGNETADMEVYKLLYNEKFQRYGYTLSDTLANKLYCQGSDVQFASPAQENIFAFSKTEEFTDNNAELKKFFTENSIAFIMGDKDLDAEWEKYKEAYLSMGGEIVRQSLLESYNTKNGTSYTFAA